MKPPLKYSLLIAAAGFAGLVSPASAASTLVPQTAIPISAQNAPAANLSFQVSVESTYQGIKGTGNNTAANATISTNEAFNNPVVAYRFWNNPTSTTFGTYAQGGGIVSDLTTTDAAFQGQTSVSLWETTASNGSAFDTTADFSSSTAIGNLDLGAVGHVDITGMSSGSLYIFYGAYRATASLSLSMTGSGSASNIDITQLHNGDFANNNEYYFARVDFTNEDNFTSLDYTIASGINHRFAGVVLTAPAPVPEPNSAALLGALGFLVLLRRRR